jgi:hypothetical protein
MIRALQPLQQFLNFGKWRQAQVKWLYFERFPRLLLGGQSQPQIPVHHLLERFPGFPHFLIQQGGNVIVERKSSAHIMMLYFMAS